MASPAMVPTGAGASAGADNGQGAGAPGGQNQQAPLQAFRQLAQQAQALAKQFPESTELMAQVLKTIQKAMVQVAGNPQRTKDTQAPPVG